MKMLVRGAIALVVLVVVLAVAGFVYADQAAKAAIERGGTYALGVPTTLDSADVGILTGEFAMSGLRVANPEGYDGPHFMRLDDGYVAVSFGTLRQELVELPALNLTGVDMVLDKKNGQANYEVILDNLKRFESKEEPDEDVAGGKRYVIRTVTVRDVTVHVSVLPVGGELTKLAVPIDEIVLEDVGTGSDRGVLLADLSGVLIKAIFAAVVEKAGGIVPGDVLGALETGLAGLQPLGDLGIEIAAGAGEAIEGAAEQIGAIGDEAGKAAEKAIEGLGGLFGDKDKDKTKKDDE